MHRGVLARAKEGVFFHCVMLVNGTNDGPGQSGQAYCLPTDFQDVNKCTLVDGYFVDL